MPQEATGAMANAGGYADIFKEGLLLFKRGDDDFYDRLNSRITVGTLVFFSAFILMDTLTQEPIDCFVPAEFNDQWVKYTDNVCWVQNTHSNFFDDGDGHTKTTSEIPYYQWVPITLLLQAILFALPGIFWSWAVEASGYDVRIYSTKERKDHNLEMSEDYRNFVIGRIFISTKPLLEQARKRSGKGVLAKDLYFGRFLTTAYLLTKLFYVMNAVAQFGLLNIFLGDGFTLLGYEALAGWLKGEEGRVGSADVFPKVTACQFDVRSQVSGDIQKHTLECLLPRNLFYEKVYIYLWWWFAFLAAVTIFGMLVWLARVTMPGAKRRFVWKYLKSVGKIDDSEKAAIQKFADIGLGSDGIFCLRIILQNSNDLTTAEVVQGIWEKWKELNEPSHNL